MSSVFIRLCGFFFDVELFVKYVGIGFVLMMKNIFMNVFMMSGENMIVFINEMLVCGVFMVLIFFGWWEVYIIMVVLKF